MTALHPHPAHWHLRRIGPGDVCDRCGRTPGDLELLRAHTGDWICRVCAYPAGGAPEDEDGHGPTRSALPPVNRPACAGCGQPLLLTRPGRTHCARCAPMIFTVSGEETP